ncbi:MAG: ATP synthase F1 subunit gamma [Clostridia bacterium]|nr:ATP synthase F1 subunit gamma [Clostridia bacterium]
MPGNTKQLKSRIRSVNSTMHITKAMELVASSKMKRAQDRLEACRPYARAVKEIFSHLAECESVFTQQRPENTVLLICIAGDRGLAGGYNNDVIKRLREFSSGRNVRTYPIGKKIREYCENHGYELFDSSDSVEKFSLDESAGAGARIVNGYLAEEFDAVYILYTEYQTLLSHEVRMQKLLPLERDDDPMIVREDILFEPDQETVLTAAVPEYLSGRIYGCVSECFSSELSARRMAMDSATKNASAMIDDLQLKYNRARQGAITQEITEIIGGSGT